MISPARIAEAIRVLDRLPGGRVIAGSLRTWALDQGVSAPFIERAGGASAAAARARITARSAYEAARDAYDLALTRFGSASTQARSALSAMTTAARTSGEAAAAELDVNAALGMGEGLPSQFAEIGVEVPEVSFGPAQAGADAEELASLIAEGVADTAEATVETGIEIASASFAAEMAALSAGAWAAISSVFGFAVGLAMLATVAYQITNHILEVQNAGHDDADLSGYSKLQLKQMADTYNPSASLGSYPTQAQLDARKAWREIQLVKYSNASIAADNAWGRLIKIFVLKDASPFIERVGVPFDETQGSMSRETRSKVTRDAHNPFTNGDAALQTFRLGLIRDDPSFRGTSVADAAAWYEDNYDAFHVREMQILENYGFKWPAGWGPEPSTPALKPTVIVLPDGMSRIQFDRSIAAFDKASLWLAINASCAVYDNADASTDFMRGWLTTDITGLAGALLIRLYTKGDVMVVACRGTLVPGGTWDTLGSAANWFSNLLDVPGDTQLGNKIDWSFLRAPFARAIGTSGTYRKIILTGHSKGGLLALQARMALQALLYMPDSAIELYSFGSPKAFSESSAAHFNATYPNIYRVEIAQDPAPSFPPLRTAVGIPYALSSSGLQQVETDKSGILNFTSDLVHALWGAHSSYNYRDKIEAWVSGRPGGQSVFDLPADTEAQVGALMKEIASRSSRAQPAVVADQAHAIIGHLQQSAPQPVLKPNMRIYRLENCPPDNTPGQVDVQKFEFYLGHR